jgi:hypothetical protein
MTMTEMLQRLLAVCVVSSFITMMILLSFSPDLAIIRPRAFSIDDNFGGGVHPTYAPPPTSASLRSSVSSRDLGSKNVPPPLQSPPPLPQWMNASRPIYLHIHMAKTAGTEHNGMLAHGYERVCGHKGYSYDAYQANVRFQKSGSTNVNAHTVRDLYSTHIDTAYGRHRVPPQVMDEIGYENCDYISNELPWTYWYEKLPLRWYAQHNISVEFHIPCRDPIDHLMSQCNYMNVNFQCPTSTTLLAREVDKCVIEMNRFSYKLIAQFERLEKSIGLRFRFTCFDALPLEPYLNYMTSSHDGGGGRLQPKRVVSSSSDNNNDYSHRPSNSKRNKNAECIWQQSVDYQDTLRKMLLDRFDYYRFCDQCRGSDHDLLFASSVPAPDNVNMAQ